MQCDKLKIYKGHSKRNNPEALKNKWAGVWNVQTNDNIIACVNKSGSVTCGIILLNDNARPHMANTIMALLQRFKWVILGHPPYSPDLSPCDYATFDPLEKALRIKWFTRTTTSNSTCRTGSQCSPGKFTRQPFTALCCSFFFNAPHTLCNLQ